MSETDQTGLTLRKKRQGTCQDKQQLDQMKRRSLWNMIQGLDDGAKEGQLPSKDDHEEKERG